MNEQEYQVIEKSLDRNLMYGKVKGAAALTALVGTLVLYWVVVISVLGDINDIITSLLNGG